MSQYETPQRGSRRLDLLKARLLQTLETAWRHHPARTAYEVYTDPVNDAGDTIGADNAEIIHDFTAQALASITSNVLAEFEVIAEEHQLLERLNLLERLHLEARKVQSDYEPEDPMAIAEETLREAKLREIDRLKSLLAQCEQLKQDASKQLSEAESMAKATIEDLQILARENASVATSLEQVVSVLGSE